ncbi:Protein PTHB1 [Amphibalanus amphitrite]|uniref:Protein PTHB1 n=1 Tax=Amphibalanus amphitrite TaxID=1232801 RepID=A0A6A4WXP7_AMPAM|nr:protein PTHB1-like [Amphibalanus amphitrite]KAF0310643.1 Protein PTHB1 [Amphibalanus amphitrite]
MSLFKAREWWSTACGTDETFDIGCMLVACIGPEKQKDQRIVVGSHEGFIRVYQPNYDARGDGDDAGAENGFRPDDLLLEVQLEHPALQLMAGKLAHSSTDTCLAVLMPFQVTVFTISMAAGAVEHGTHYALNPVYSHRLKRSAFNMFSGFFGGSKNKELFSIQSLDGTLSFYEQENYSFSRFLPGYLIPGPILYVQKTDSVVTGTSSWTVEAYKYSSLAQGSDPNEKSSGDIGSGKRVYPDWTYNVGEVTLDIQQVTLPSGDVRLAVLAEHSLLILKEAGQPVLFKRLDYHPACLTTFVNDAGRLTTLVASHTSVGHVYEGGTLRWAAQLPFIPVCVGRLRLRQLSGLLALLSAGGQLVVAYLGTTPSLFVAPPVQTAGALDYEALDEELATLTAVIQRSQKQDETGLAAADANREDVQLVVQIHPVLDPCSLPTEVDQQVPCASIRALITPLAPVQSVVLSFDVVSPLVVVKPSAGIESLTTTTDIEAVVYLAQPHAVPSLELETVLSYLTSSGAPRVLRAVTRLPLALVARPADPVKDADHRVTVCTTRPSVNLAQLFSDLKLDAGMSSAAGIEYYTGCTVTILASKTSQRYRLQSDDFHALWLVTEELTRRIGAMYGETADEPICSFVSSLPLQDVFSEVDAHLMWRQRREQQLQQLEQRASQFRAIQRRLLTKYKDMTPSPLTNMDQLLEETYRRLMAQADSLSEEDRRLERSAAQLSCALRLLALLARLSQTLTPEEADLLTAALCWRRVPSQEQGWHETADCAAGYLHRALQQQTGRVAVSGAPLAMPDDTTKLKRHLALLLEKVLKAGARIGDSVNRTDAPADEPVADKDERPPSVHPISQMFTQRLGSARPRSGTRRPVSGASSSQRLHAPATGPPVPSGRGPPPTVAVEPPTPQLDRSRPTSADSVDAESRGATAPEPLVPGTQPETAAEQRDKADGAGGDVQHLHLHGLTGAGIEVPRDNLLDEPEEDFW